MSAGPSASASDAITMRFPRAAACRANAGANSPTAATSVGAGRTAITASAAAACNLALSAPNSNIEPTTTARGRRWRPAYAAAKSSAARIELGLAL